MARPIPLPAPVTMAVLLPFITLTPRVSGVRGRPRLWRDCRSRSCRTRSWIHCVTDPHPHIGRVDERGDEVEVLTRRVWVGIAHCPMNEPAVRIRAPGLVGQAPRGSVGEAQGGPGVESGSAVFARRGVGEGHAKIA